MQTKYGLEVKLCSGDKVLLRRDLVPYEEYENISFVDAMESMKETPAEIIGQDNSDHTYYTKEGFYITNEMIDWDRSPWCEEKMSDIDIASILFEQ